jgi:hypothetical protein
MSLLTDHFVVLVALATLIAAFLSLLWKDDARARRRLFVRIWLGLVGGALAAAWLLYPSPRP